MPVLDMDAEVKRFSLEITEEAEKWVEEDAARFLRVIGMKAWSKFISRTPVKTGRLKGNWQVGVTREPSRELKVLDKDGSRTRTKGELQILNAKAFDVLYIVNNLPYASYIENGHSKIKAPRGMVRISLEEIKMEFGE